MSNRRLALKEKSARTQVADDAILALSHLIPKTIKPTPPRWVCYHHASGSDIDAYVWAQDHLETIATTVAMDGVSARANAELIVRAVNGFDLLAPTIHEMIRALERWREQGNLNSAVRAEAENLLRRAKRVVG